MSKEENIAIKTLKEVASDDFDTLGDDISPKMAQDILNVIDEQRTEIEVLKTKYKDLFFHNFELWEKNIFPTKALEEKFISKDKIREKIKAFQDVKKEIIKNENKLSRASITYDIVRNDYCEKMLQKLLEEN